MGRPRTSHRCSDCGSSTPRWAGRCPACGEWGTLVEVVETPTAPATAALGGWQGGGAWPPGGAGGAGAGGAGAVPLAGIDAAGAVPVPTGIPELDRVLGGGLVPGSVTLIGGEPGVGKSTLLLQAMAAIAAGGRRCLLVSAEESAQQVRRRADRLGALGDGTWLVAETSLPAIAAAVEQVRPDVVVVDSVQTVWDPATESAPGSVTQVRSCAAALTALAKAAGPAVVLVGHVTKDGALAGPRVLEHVVDTVLTFEGDRNHALRMLRSVKHRFGSTGELGVFEMGDGGLAGVPDPSGLFLGDRRPGTPGSVVVPLMEGYRALLVEVQALVVASNLAAPRRQVSGVDGGRLSLLLAVLHQRAGLSCLQSDVYVSAVGGARVYEPGADLGIAMALASAAADRPLPEGLVVLGEVGLAGELRQVVNTERRLREAARLGYATAIVPASAPDVAGVRMRRCATLAEATGAVLGAEGSTLTAGPVTPRAPARPPGPGVVTMLRR